MQNKNQHELFCRDLENWGDFHIFNAMPCGKQHEVIRILDDFNVDVDTIISIVVYVVFLYLQINGAPIGQKKYISPPHRSKMTKGLEQLCTINNRERKNKA